MSHKSLNTKIAIRTKAQRTELSASLEFYTRYISMVIGLFFTALDRDWPIVPPIGIVSGPLFHNSFLTVIGVFGSLLRCVIAILFRRSRS